MRSILILISLSLVVALLCASLPQSPTVHGDTDALIAQLDSSVPKWLAHYRIPGVVISLVVDSQVVWTQAYGLADKASGAPMKVDSVLQASSISKTTAAWGILKLVQAGRLDLDAPIEKYLTHFRLHDSVYDKNQVTARRLLSHNAGLNVIRYNGYLPDERLPSLDESLVEWEGQGLGVRIIRQPGTGFNYSDTNYCLLQLAVEGITGEGFPEYMQREVLDPLGMTDSAYTWTPSLRSRTVTGYDARGEAWPTFQFSELATAGLYTTAPQLALFLTAAMPGPHGEPVGRGLLPPEVIAEMTSPQVEIRGSDRYIYAQAYGWGYFVETLSTGEAAFSHMGGNEGHRSNIAAVPSKRSGMAVLTNSDLGHELFADILTTWTTWLGVGPLMVANTIQVARRIILGLCGFMDTLALGFFLMLAGALRSGRRCLGLGTGRKPRLWRALGAAALVLGILAYWLFGDYIMQADMPSIATPLALSITWAGLVGLLALFAPRCDPNPSTYEN
ncbi:MAG: serine hydrolase domain-containing protein [Chloroflexota bacterium]